MKQIAALLTILAFSAQAQEVRPIHDTDACEYIDIIEVVAFDEKGIGSSWAKRVESAGGNAFKVIHVYRQRSNYGDQTNAIVEVYRCE